MARWNLFVSSDSLLEMEPGKFSLRSWAATPSVIANESILSTGRSARSPHTRAIRRREEARGVGDQDTRRDGPTMFRNV